jgi:prevent-host-death family protein
MAIPKQRPTETMSVSEARKHFSETLDRVRESDARVVIEKSGIPVAAVVPLGVLRDAEERERRRQEALQTLRDAQAGFAGVSEREAEVEIEKALDEIRQEQRIARRIVSALVQSDPQVFSSSEPFLVAEVARLLREEEARKLATEQHRQDRSE